MYITIVGALRDVRSETNKERSNERKPRKVAACPIQAELCSLLIALALSLGVLFFFFVCVGVWCVVV
jgi:hypothetical protein